MSPPEPRKEELSAAPVGTEVLGRDATRPIKRNLLQRRREATKRQDELASF